MAKRTPVPRPRRLRPAARAKSDTRRHRRPTTHPGGLDVITPRAISPSRQLTDDEIRARAYLGISNGAARTARISTTGSRPNRNCASPDHCCNRCWADASLSDPALAYEPCGDSCDRGGSGGSDASVFCESRLGRKPIISRDRRRAETLGEVARGAARARRRGGRSTRTGTHRLSETAGPHPSPDERPTGSPTAFIVFDLLRD